MTITREWAMPNKFTFQISPIIKLLHKYVGDGKNWIDPFAGFKSPAEFTNDLNPERKAIYCMRADDFIQNVSGPFRGCLFDPPYSNEQIKRTYESIGLRFTIDDSQGLFQNEKKMIAPKIENNGIAICFGWNSNGFGKKLGFELIEILLLAHGSMHNDTIVTVERKFQSTLI